MPIRSNLTYRSTVAAHIAAQEVEAVMDTRSECFVKELKAAMKARRLNQVELADLTGLDKGYVCRMIKHGHIPKIDALFKLADGLNEPRLAWLVAAGYLREEDIIEVPPEVKAILGSNPLVLSLFKQLAERFATLNETERERLRHAIESVVQLTEPKQ